MLISCKANAFSIAAEHAAAAVGQTLLIHIVFQLSQSVFQLFHQLVLMLCSKLWTH
jgi:hypothetical protein